MDIRTIEYKLEKLREVYKTAGLEKRKTILIQARLLTTAKEICMQKQQKLL